MTNRRIPWRAIAVAAIAVILLAVLGVRAGALGMAALVLLVGRLFWLRDNRNRGATIVELSMRRLEMASLRAEEDGRWGRWVSVKCGILPTGMLDLVLPYAATPASANLAAAKVVSDPPLRLQFAIAGGVWEVECPDEVAATTLRDALTEARRSASE